jgi:hypothetical protein
MLSKYNSCLFGFFGGYLQVGDNCQTKQDKHSAGKTNGEINGDIPHCGGVVSAIRNIEIIEQEIMAATGCNVSCLKKKNIKINCLNIQTCKNMLTIGRSIVIKGDNFILDFSIQ